MLQTIDFLLQTIDFLLQPLPANAYKQGATGLSKIRKSFKFYIRPPLILTAAAGTPILRAALESPFP